MFPQFSNAQLVLKEKEVLKEGDELLVCDNKLVRFSKEKNGVVNVSFSGKNNFKMGYGEAPIFISKNNLYAATTTNGGNNADQEIIKYDISKNSLIKKSQITFPTYMVEIAFFSNGNFMLIDYENSIVKFYNTNLDILDEHALNSIGYFSISGDRVLFVLGSNIPNNYFLQVMSSNGDILLNKMVSDKGQVIKSQYKNVHILVDHYYLDSKTYKTACYDLDGSKIIEFKHESNVKAWQFSDQENLLVIFSSKGLDFVRTKGETPIQSYSLQQIFSELSLEDKRGDFSLSVARIEDIGNSNIAVVIYQNSKSGISNNYLVTIDLNDFVFKTYDTGVATKSLKFWKLNNLLLVDNGVELYKYLFSR